MGDPREEFLHGVEFSDIHVREYPKIAFLCGGSPSPLDDDEGIQHFPSVRSYIAQILSIKDSSLRYQHAEDIKDWNSYSVYNDLIEFEKDIGHICKAIILFVESPGSIAELGSFCMIPEVSDKLLVFVHSRYSDSSSFLTLGPIRKINHANDESIHYITWDEIEIKSQGVTLSTVDIESIKEWGNYTCDQISEKLKKRSHLR